MFEWLKKKTLNVEDTWRWKFAWLYQTAYRRVNPCPPLYAYSTRQQRRNSQWARAGVDAWIARHERDQPFYTPEEFAFKRAELISLKDTFERFQTEVLAPVREDLPASEYFIFRLNLSEPSHTKYDMMRIPMPPGLTEASYRARYLRLADKIRRSGLNYRTVAERLRRENQKNSLLTEVERATNNGMVAQLEKAADDMQYILDRAIATLPAQDVAQIRSGVIVE